MNKPASPASMVPASAGICLLILAGCSGNDGAPGPAGAPSSGSSPDQDIILQVGDTVAVVDPNAYEVKRQATLDIGTDSSLNNSHKSWFHDGLMVIGGGGAVWAFDKDTLELAARTQTPSVQMNREGTVGSGQVNTLSSVSAAPLTKDERRMMRKTILTPAESAQYDMCDIYSRASVAAASQLKAPGDTVIYDMGYSPVGLETTPDGSMAVAGVRQGDHLLVLDVDQASPTFGQPLRFVDQRRGQIKDATNAVVGTFTSQYAGFTGATGTAPGDLRRDRDAGATGGETDGETYVEPCDTNIIRNANGEVWFWSVDVDGDTYTLMRIDTITSPTPTVVQVTVPVVRDTATVGSTSGLQYVGPWMGGIMNRAEDGIMIGTSENEGEDSESVWDLSDPLNPVEVGRYVPDLQELKGEGVCTGGASGGPTLASAAPFTDSSTYSVNVDFTSTGGSCVAVDYTYNDLTGGDDLSGTTDNRLFTSTAYLEKVNAGDPGPTYIINGLAGRPGTSEGNVAVITGEGTDSVVYSDEIWLPTNNADPNVCTFPVDCDIFQIVNLKTSPPWLIDETIDVASSFAGKFGVDNKYYQINGEGDLEVIDGNETPKRIVRTVKYHDATTGAPFDIQSVNIRTP